MTYLQFLVPKIKKSKNKRIPTILTESESSLSLFSSFTFLNSLAKIDIFPEPTKFFSHKVQLAKSRTWKISCHAMLKIGQNGKPKTHFLQEFRHERKIFCTFEPKYNSKPHNIMLIQNQRQQIANKLFIRHLQIV